MLGIDISQFNKVRDLKEAKKGGLDFVIIRASGQRNQKAGTMPYKDNMFEKHYNLAKEAGLNVGAYFYVAPVPLVKAEDTAAACLDILKGHNFEMPVYLDCELWNVLDKTGNTVWANTFMYEIEKHNAFVGLYGSDISTFQSLVNINDLKHWSWWVAKYSDHKPKYAKQNCHIWQYSNKGLIPGIEGYVDLNESFLSFDVIKRRGMNIF